MLFQKLIKQKQKKNSFDGHIGENRDTLLENIELLEKERKRYNTMKNQQESLKKEYGSSKDLAVSNKLQYHLWLAGSVFLLIVTLRHLLSK